MLPARRFRNLRPYMGMGYSVVIRRKRCVENTFTSPSGQGEQIMTSRKGKLSIGSLGKVDATPQADANLPTLAVARSIVAEAEAYMAMVETQRAPFRILADAGMDIKPMLMQVGLDYDSVNAYANKTWPNLAEANALIAYSKPEKFGDVRTAELRSLPEHTAMVVAIAKFRAAMPAMPSAPKGATVFESVSLSDGHYTCRVELSKRSRRGTDATAKPRATATTKPNAGTLRGKASGYNISVDVNDDGTMLVMLSREPSDAIVYSREYAANVYVTISQAVNDALQAQDDVSAKTRYSMRTLFGEQYDRIMGITA